MEKLTVDFDTWLNFLAEMEKRKATREEFNAEMLNRFGLTPEDLHKSPAQLKEEGRI